MITDDLYSGILILDIVRRDLKYNFLKPLAANINRWARNLLVINE